MWSVEVLRAQLFWRKQIEVGKRRSFPSIGNRCLAAALSLRKIKSGSSNTLANQESIGSVFQHDLHFFRILFENELLLVGVDKCSYLPTDLESSGILFPSPKNTKNRGVLFKYHN